MNEDELTDPIYMYSVVLKYTVYFSPLCLNLNFAQMHSAPN